MVFHIVSSSSQALGLITHLGKAVTFRPSLTIIRTLSMRSLEIGFAGLIVDIFYR